MRLVLWSRLILRCSRLRSVLRLWSILRLRRILLLLGLLCLLLRCEQFELNTLYFRVRLLHALLVGVLSCVGSALDIHLIAFVKVLLCDLCLLATTDDVEPLCVLRHLRTALCSVTFVRYGNSKATNLSAVLERANIGVFPQVANQNLFINAHSAI